MAGAPPLVITETPAHVASAARSSDARGRSPATSGVSWFFAIVVTLAAALVPAMLWPGDMTWMNDEPALVAQAYHLNHEAHLPARRGLTGSFPIPYGPFPTQLYQFGLLFTHDLVLMAMVRAAICAGLTAVALLCLARALRLSPWFAAAVVLAPNLWYTNRTLWDVSFAIPAATGCVAAYAWFLRYGSGRALAIAAATALLVPLIHLQGIPLLLAVGGHMIWRERAALRLYRRQVLTAVIPVLLLNSVYIAVTGFQLVTGLANLIRSGHSSKVPVLLAASGPFRSGRLFSAADFSEFFSHLRGPAWLVHGAGEISMLFYPLAWAGLALCAWRAVQLYRRAHRARTRSAAADSSSASRAFFDGPRDTIVLLTLTAFAAQVGMFALMRVPPAPHYFYGTFPLHALLAWFTIDALRRARLTYPAIGLWGASLAVITIGSMVQVHRNGWEMSPTLANQVEVARELGHYTDTSVADAIPLYQSYPHALRALTLIYPPDRATPRSASPAGLLIRYRPGPNGPTNRIELVELHSTADIPAGATTLDVTPLPRPIY